MKTTFQLFSAFLISIILSSGVNAGVSDEILIRNETYTYTESDYGWHYWYDMSIYPSNWHSPVDYWNGKIYCRFEIISQGASGTSTEPLNMSYILWDVVSGSGDELAGKWNYIAGGPGSIFADNDGSAQKLANFYVVGSGIDMTNINNVKRMGCDVRDKDGKGVSNPAWGYDADLWSQRAKWYPLEVKMTVVAVPSGMSFSGWENYGGTSGGSSSGGSSSGGSSSGGSSSGGSSSGGGDDLAQPSPTPSALAIEAEDMTLVNYFKQGFPGTASEDTVAGLWNAKDGYGNSSGHISTTFPHASGFYDIKVVYRAEDDGQSPFSFEINSSTVASWTGILESGNDEYETYLITNKELNTGDVLKVNGQKESSAWAKIDYIDFTFLGVEAPSYTINYGAEETNESVSSDDEYSYDQSSWTSGAGSKLDLTPGQTVYFRPKIDPGNVQTLNVPSRPSAPTFSISYINEVANTGISTTYEVSTDNFASAGSTFSGTQVNVTPGQNLYLRKVATGSAFKSQVQTLTVPARPAAPVFTIDYEGEKAFTETSGTYQHSTDNFSSDIQQFTGTELALTPNEDVQLRKKATGSAFASSVTSLTVPGRAATPNFTVDYMNEVLTSPTAAEYEYSHDNFATIEGTFNGAEVDVEPGMDYYIQRKASASNFASAIQMIEVDDRPSAPSFSINFSTEKTNESVIADQEYKTESESDWTSGSGLKIDLEPGELYSIRNKATAGSFASEASTLDIPERPALDDIAVDFYTSRTTVGIPTDVQYSENSDMSNPSNGLGIRVDLTPGVDLYFYKPSTSEAYESDIFHLDVPAAPVIEAITDISGTVTNYPIEMSVTFDGEVTGFTVEDISTNKSLIENLTGSYTFELYPTATGTINVYLLPNKVDQGNFASNTVTITYDGPLILGVEEQTNNLFNMYPNPSTGLLNIDFESAGVHIIRVFDSKGSMISEHVFESQNETLDLHELKQGLYMIRCTDEAGNTNHRQVIMVQ